MNIYECLPDYEPSRASLWRLGEALAGTNAVLLIGEFETPGDPLDRGRAVWIGVRDRLRYRHLKRGSEYSALGRGLLQSSVPISEGETLVAYVGDDGRLWFRPQGEFDDGRFVELGWDGAVFGDSGGASDRQMGVHAYDVTGHGLTLIERCVQRDGPARWALRHRGMCLNHDGEFEIEPQPSARDDAFLQRCRFDSPRQAFEAWRRFNA
jgi:hypothetical protein